jgi:hypothetical protein
VADLVRQNIYGPKCRYFVNMIMIDGPCSVDTLREIIRIMCNMDCLDLSFISSATDWPRRNGYSLKENLVTRYQIRSLRWVG